MTTREARKSKGIYNKWKEEDLIAAVHAVEEGLGINKAADMFNIPKTTLKRRLKHTRDSKCIGRPHDLPKEVEEDLVKHLLHLENMFYGYVYFCTLLTVS